MSGLIEEKPSALTRAATEEKLRRAIPACTLWKVATVLKAAIVLAVLLSGATVPAETNHEPLRLHPANPHYFLFREKPAVLITSGEHYGAVLNLDFDFAAYLDELASHGLNLTRTWAGIYREIPGSFGITDNTLAPLSGRYICPWARGSVEGYSQGGNKFDLSRWDEAYFQRLKDFMAHASRRGVVVELNLFCPMYEEALWDVSPMNAKCNVNGIGACGSKEVFTLKHKDLVAAQDAVTRKLVEELSGFDNLYYEICNEPYFGGVTLEWQHHIADVIAGAEASLARKHLISQNVANGSAKVEKPHPAVSIFNFHYAVPPDAVAANYGLGRVIGENETGFRGKEDRAYRTEGWDFVLAGGGLYNNLDYSFTAKQPRGTLLEYKSPGGGSPALRAQLKALKDFMEGLDFIKMAPDTSVVRGGVPAGMWWRALSEPGKAYAVYVHAPAGKGEPLKEPLKEVEAPLVLELPGGSYEAQWLNPRRGTVETREAFDHKGGEKTLTSPRFSEDIALRVVKK